VVWGDFCQRRHRSKTTENSARSSFSPDEYDKRLQKFLGGPDLFNTVALGQSPLSGGARVSRPVTTNPETVTDLHRD
jgi:hypothetical protein